MPPHAQWCRITASPPHRSVYPGVIVNLYQDVFFRALDLPRRRRTITRLHSLRRTQYWDPERLRTWQLGRLNVLLSQAQEHSPYYRRVLADTSLPLRSLDDLESLPPLTKERAREHYEAIPSGNLPKSRFIPNRTGGSTGEPMHYFWDRRGRDWNRASVYRSAESGWCRSRRADRGDVRVSLRPHSSPNRDKPADRPAHALPRLFGGVSDEELLDRYYRGILEWRPTSIWGYASGIATLAEYVLDRHPEADFSFVRAAVTSSETLRPGQRELIERVFGQGTVYDNYGSREMYMAAECREHSGYHLHGEVVLLEVVDHHDRPCSPGKRGRILVTDLSNHAFPFIRYEVGDVGTMAEPSLCSCGVRLPKLAAVEGRIADMVVLRDRVLTPPNFTILMSDVRGVAGYQIRQESVDRLDVHLVPGPGYTPKVADYVRASIERMVEGQAHIEVREVAEIDVPESGKRRYIVSSVSREHL